MVEIIKLTEKAYNLWNKIVDYHNKNEKKPQKITNEELKNINDNVAVSKPLKDELIEKGLFKDLKSKPQSYQLIMPQPDVKIEQDIEISGVKAKKTTRKKTTQQTLSLSSEDSLSSSNLQIIMEHVGKYCQPYFEKIEAMARDLIELKEILKKMNLSEKINLNQVQPKAPQTPTFMNQDVFFKHLIEYCNSLDSSQKFGGAIPIPEVWMEFQNKKEPIDWDTFKNYLMNLESNRSIDLQIANDPKQVRFPEKGIQVPGRGLIYYLSLR